LEKDTAVATYNKFNQFTKDLIDGKHNFSSNVFKVMLTNTAPVATNAIKGDLTEISAGAGYTAGGATTTITATTTSGTAKVSGTNVVFTADGGSIGPVRYAVIYNDTQTSPAKPLVGWWDYGSSITLAADESLTVTFDGTNGIFTVT
jgi:hypothetical protein